MRFPFSSEHPPPLVRATSLQTSPVRARACLHYALWALLALLVACGGSKARHRNVAKPQPAPYVGFSNTPGPTDTLKGTTGPLNGKEYWLSTAATNLPSVGSFGEVKWTLDRSYGPFGKGVIMGMGEVQVKQVQPGAQGMTSQILLVIMRGDGGISFNGQAVNVITAGKQVDLVFKR